MKSSSKFLYFTIVVICICSAVDLFAEDRGISVADIFVGGEISSPVVIENYRGELFFLYEQNGGLIVKKSGDGGNTFNEYPLDIPFSGVKDIVLFNQFYTIWNVFVIARYNGVENIFYYTLNDTGELVLAHDGPIGEHAAGTITGLQATKGQLDNHMVSYVQGGRLKLIMVDPLTGHFTQISVSPGNERVSDYYIEYHLLEDFTLIHRGYYTTRGEEEGSRLTYFEVDGTNSVETVFVTEGSAGFEDYTFFSEFHDRIGFSLIKAGSITYYYRDKGEWLLPKDVFLPFTLRDSSTLNLGMSSYSFLLAEDGKGYLDLDGIRGFENLVPVSSGTLEGADFFISEEWNFKGISFIETSSPPVLHVKEFREMDGGYWMYDRDVPVDLPGEMVDCVYLKNDGIFLGLFDSNGVVFFSIGSINAEIRGFSWVPVDTGGGGVPGDIPEVRLLFSGIKESVYKTGGGFLVFDKENPGSSRFLAQAVFASFALEDEERPAFVSAGELVLVGREGE